MKLPPAPDYVLEIFLQPGEFYWSDAFTRIRTVLGSCVALCVWHPKKNIGGMCHYILAYKREDAGEELDPRYGSDAVKMILREIRQAGTAPGEYHVKMFGGSNMFPDVEGRRLDIGAKNIVAGEELLKRHGFHIRKARIGGTRPHNIIFDLWSGNVWVKREE